MTSPQTRPTRWRGHLRLVAPLSVAALGLAPLTLVPGVAAPVAAEPRTTPFLRHTGTFFVQENLRAGEGDQATSAEIIAFSRDRRTLVYTDAFTRRLGFVDTTDPGDPRPAGTLDLPGDPTSVGVVGDLALVAVVTSEDPDGEGPLTSFDAPSGSVLVVDLRSREVVRTIPLAGQPDAVAVAPSKRFAAIVIENERDEDEADGLLPQSPAGLLQVLRLTGGPAAWTTTDVALTGLTAVAPDDPEPEYVDINRRDRAVVTLQENNHLAVVDLPTARVVRDFSAGSVDLTGIDTTEEEVGPQGSGLLSLDGALDDRRREPDSVHWVDDDTFVTANEGDYTDEEGVEGGSRSFTLFHASGRVEYESGNRLEHQVVRAGHYPESRSENKGTEPEGLEVAHVGGRTYLFVGAERANVVGVYELVAGRPVFRQLLPTGIGPEGLVYAGGVLAVSSEVDGLNEGFAARPFLTFFGWRRSARPAYPMLASRTTADGPIPWVAQSGLSGDPRRPHTLWSVSDSVLGQAYLYRVRTHSSPATIVRRIPVGGTGVADQRTGDYDLEGVAARREGGFWLASEGRVEEGSSRPNLVLRTDARGRVLRAVPLPDTLTEGATSSGLEGVAVTGTRARGNETVYVVVQREWADDAPGLVKLGRYDVAERRWTFASYPLDEVESPAGGWVGLSEVAALGDRRLAILERDNQLGLEARVKRVYAVDPASVRFAPAGDPLPVLDKTLVRDVLGDLDAASISVPDKVEGLGITGSGRAYLVTDNDGVDESYGETVLVPLPRAARTGWK